MKLNVSIHQCLALAALLGALACDSSHIEPLPRLQAPAGMNEIEQANFLRAHFEEFIRHARHNLGKRFDSDIEFGRSHTQATIQLMRWEDRIMHFKPLDAAGKRALVVRMPAVARFRGARKRAVALGLLALSIARQYPPDSNPTPNELWRCNSISRPCAHKPRTLALRHFILMGQYADRALFDRLSKPAARPEDHE